jgi:hypothetical protein
MGDGHVVVTAVNPISLQDITGSLARQCGFNGTVDLLKVAQHGSGRNVFVIDFHYEINRGLRPPPANSAH